MLSLTPGLYQQREQKLIEPGHFFLNHQISSPRFLEFHCQSSIIAGDQTEREERYHTIQV